MIFRSNIPELEYITIEELKSLYKELERQYIPYENTTVHETLRKIKRLVDYHEQLATRNSRPTQ